MLGFSGHRKWVYPLAVTGRYQQIHRWSGRVMLAWLVAVPWIPFGNHPAVRIDLPGRRVYALSATFTASDGFLLVLMALFAAFSLFLVTSLYGRLWCGYACPQTVFLHEFVHPIERFVEGDRGRRSRRDKGPLTVEWVLRRALKWVLFGLVAFLAAMSFQSWFAGGYALWTGRAGPVDYALVGTFTLAWFGDFAWFREQACNYVCPYARLQGALTDEHSLVVAYHSARGEPRGAKASTAHGACIDCQKCVFVCPQGIDIRDGYQLECINCGRCVDACAEVQRKLGHPSLVGYVTLVSLAGGVPRRLRPRTVVYTGLLVAIAAGIVFLLWSHAPVEAQVQRQPGSLYAVDPDGWIRNTYLVRVTSREADTSAVVVTVQGIPEAEIVIPLVVLAPGESRTVPLIVRVPPGADLPRTIPFRVELRTEQGAVTRDATFKTPGST